jgi:TPR repeat protein
MAFRSIAEQGYAPAQYELAMLYHYGYGVSKDYKAGLCQRKIGFDRNPVIS